MPVIRLGAPKPKIRLVGKPVTKRVVEKKIIRLKNEKRKRKKEPKLKIKLTKIPRRTRRPFISAKDPISEAEVRLDPKKVDVVLSKIAKALTEEEATQIKIEEIIEKPFIFSVLVIEINIMRAKLLAAEVKNYLSEIKNIPNRWKNFIEYYFARDEGFRNYTLAVGVEGDFEDYADWMNIKEEFKNAPAYAP